MSPVEELRRLVVSVTLFRRVGDRRDGTQRNAQRSCGGFSGRVRCVSIDVADLHGMGAAFARQVHEVGNSGTCVWRRSGRRPRLSMAGRQSPLGLRPVGVIGDREDARRRARRSLVCRVVERNSRDRRKTARLLGRRRSARRQTELKFPPRLQITYTRFRKFMCFSELTGLARSLESAALDGLAGIHLQQNLMLPLPRFTKRVMDYRRSDHRRASCYFRCCFISAVAVKMSSRGPVFYANERIGRGRQPLPHVEVPLNVYRRRSRCLRNIWRQSRVL